MIHMEERACVANIILVSLTAFLFLSIRTNKELKVLQNYSFDDKIVDFILCVHSAHHVCNVHKFHIHVGY